MKRILAAVLILIILLTFVSLAGEDVFYTTKEEAYYHKDSSCDEEQKYPISQSAAELFGKIPCPVCVVCFFPVYTGSYVMDEKTFEKAWIYGGNSVESISVPDIFLEESAETNRRFDEIHKQEFSQKTLSFELTVPYPDDYAGRYRNAAGGMTYLLKNPDDAKIKAFHNQYGGGVFIAPAKYGMNELENIRKAQETAVFNFNREHPDKQLIFVSSYIDIPTNTVRIGLSGEYAETYIGDTEFPACVRVRKEEIFTAG